MPPHDKLYEQSRSTGCGRQPSDSKFDLTVGELAPIFDNGRLTTGWTFVEELAGLSPSLLHRQSEIFVWQAVIAAFALVAKVARPIRDAVRSSHCVNLDVGGQSRSLTMFAIRQRASRIVTTRQTVVLSRHVAATPVVVVEVTRPLSGRESERARERERGQGGPVCGHLAGGPLWGTLSGLGSFEREKSGGEGRHPFTRYLNLGFSGLRCGINSRVEGECYRGGFRNSFWPSFHAADCTLMCSSAANGLAVLSARCPMSRPHTMSYRILRAYEIGGATRFDLLSMHQDPCAGQKNIAPIEGDRATHCLNNDDLLFEQHARRGAVEVNRWFGDHIGFLC